MVLHTTMRQMIDAEPWQAIPVHLQDMGALGIHENTNKQDRYRLIFVVAKFIFPQVEF